MANEVTWLIKGTSVKQRERKEGGRRKGGQKAGKEGQREGRQAHRHLWSHTGVPSMCAAEGRITRAKEFEASLGNRESEFP